MIARYNEEAETELLKIFTNNQPVFQEFLESTKPEYFSDMNRILFTALKNMDSKNFSFEEIMLKEEIKSVTKLSIPENVISNLFLPSKDIGFAKGLHHTIFESWRKYRLFELANQLKDKVSSQCPASEYADIVNQMVVLDSGSKSMNTRPQYLVEIAKDVIKEIELDIVGDNTVSRNFYYGSGALRKLGVMKRSNAYLFSARPAHGKTSLLLNILYYNAFVEKKRVVFFSLEMSKTEILEKLYCIHYNYPTLLMRQMTDLQAKNQMIKTFEQYLIYSKIELIIDTEHKEIGQMCNSAKILNAQKKIDIIAFDYIQLIMVQGRLNELPRNQQLAHILLHLKNDIINGLDVVGIYLAQMERKGDDDVVPKMSDLSDCSQLEKDASDIWFIKNWNVIGKSTIKVGYSKSVDAEGCLALINAKSRFSQVGACALLPFSFCLQKNVNSKEDALLIDNEIKIKESKFLEEVAKQNGQG